MNDNSSDLLNGLLPFPVSFTTLALMLFAIIAVIGFMRGVLRLFFGTIALAIGALVAYFVYLRAPEMIESPRGVLIAAIVAGLATYLGARFIILGVVLRPFLGKHRGLIGRAGAIASLVPSIFLIWVLATGLRLSGTVMEMEQVGENVTAAEGETVEEGWIAHWRRALDNDFLGKLLAKINPFVEQGKTALVNLLISGRDESATGELVDSGGEAADIANNPAVKELQSDPEIRALVENGEYLRLLQHPKVRAAVEDNALADKLKQIDIVGSLEKALFEKEGGERRSVRRRIPKRLYRERGDEQPPDQN